MPLTDGEHDGALDPVHRGEGRGGPQAGQLLAPRLQPAVAEAVAHEGGLGDVSEHHLAGHRQGNERCQQSFPAIFTMFRESTN